MSVLVSLWCLYFYGIWITKERGNFIYEHLGRERVKFNMPIIVRMIIFVVIKYSIIVDVLFIFVYKKKR